MLQDQLAVACVVTIELKAGLADDQRLKKRLALDERKLGDVPICQMQEIESVIDEWAALAARVRAKLGSPGVIATKLAIDVSGRHLRFASAAMTPGYLAVQSSPVLVSSCAWPLSMRAAIR